MSDDEYKTHCAKLSKGIRSYLATLSDQERSLRSKHSWDMRSDESRKKHASAISEAQKIRWASMSPTEKLHMSEMNSLSAKKFWKMISDTDYAKRQKESSERSLSYWNNLSLEQARIWHEHHQNGLKEYFENLGSSPNKNEASFKNLASDFGLVCQYQYTTSRTELTFYEKFKDNEILLNLNISPYHNWDYRIETADGSAFLIDIDGSIHDPTQTNYMVTQPNGKSFILCDYIQLKDSQRKYQTEGHPAYIVQCYDDNLTMDSSVYDISNDVYITLYEMLRSIREHDKNT